MQLRRVLGLLAIVVVLVAVISEPVTSAASARSGGAALGDVGTSVGRFLTVLGGGLFGGAAASSPASLTSGGGATYTVAPGDTLCEIAATRGTTSDALADVNDLPDPDLIRPGQVLTLG